MKEVYIVIRPDDDSDFFLDGIFTNVEAAESCASDPNAEYEGRVITINFENAKDSYESPYDEDDDDDEDD